MVQKPVRSVYHAGSDRSKTRGDDSEACGRHTICPFMTSDQCPGSEHCLDTGSQCPGRKVYLTSLPGTGQCHALSCRAVLPLCTSAGKNLVKQGFQSYRERAQAPRDGYSSKPIAPSYGNLPDRCLAGYGDGGRWWAAPG
jgi:hypothetical protein